MSSNKGVAWYDVKGSGPLRDIFILLHPPYTLWHLSYIPLGAALAPVMNWPLLGWTVLAFFLGMGIAGHCLDELNGRPLRTTLPTWLLSLVAMLALFGAIYIGGTMAYLYNLWIIPLMLFGFFIVLAYNLEWGKGFFHRDEWFGIAWGAFPLITAYVAQTGRISGAVLLLAGFAYYYSMAQRKLSMQSRFWRRKVVLLRGDFWVDNAGKAESAVPLIKQVIIGPADLALTYMNVAVVVAAAGLLLMRM